MTQGLGTIAEYVHASARPFAATHLPRMFFATASNRPRSLVCTMNLATRLACAGSLSTIIQQYVSAIKLISVKH